jgi:hypothetical protein
MKSLKKLYQLFLSAFVLHIAFTISTSLTARDYYQIKVYNIKDMAQETSVDTYLKNAYIHAMHRAGIKEVGVFKPVADDPAAGKKIFVLIRLKELGDIEKIEQKLAADKEYQTAGVSYIDAPYSSPPYERIESILLKAFAEHPDLKLYKYNTPKSEQIFELRSYQGATEKIWKKKVEMFNEGGEVGIFKNVGSNAVFYGEVLSGSDMPNLIYMTSYENMDSNKKHWDAFRDHPDWKKLSGMEEYKNTVSHIDKWMLHPTEYSDI